jgi:hypothetical protein
MPAQFDTEKTENNIGFILEKMKTEPDPLVLNKYRALFKRRISFFDRSWAAAYLLMLYDQGNLGRGRGAGASGGKAGRGRKDQGGRAIESRRRIPPKMGPSKTSRPVIPCRKRNRRTCSSA